MNKVLLLIGGNEGDRVKNILHTNELISKYIGNIIKTSSMYESEPWGFNHQQNFINQVIEVSTNLSPNEVLKEGLLIEKKLGRKPKKKLGYEGRTMDVDILFYDNSILNENQLIIPHPKLHERKFTLLPLKEKWNDLIHPVFLKSIDSLNSECKDDGWVEKFEY